MKSKTKSSRGRSILAHTVLILLSFMCLFFFAILLGGNGWDAVGAGAAGIGMVLILYLGRKIGLNDFFQLLLASAVIAVVAYLAAENPIVFLRGNKTLKEFGIRNGSHIIYRRD